MSQDPRYRNGSARRKQRARFKAMGCPCAICGGEIHYGEPSDAQHPLSFVIDEIIPVSRYKAGGYDSPEAAALDWNNVQAVHYICNAKKGNRLFYHQQAQAIKTDLPDGEW